MSKSEIIEVIFNQLPDDTSLNQTEIAINLLKYEGKTADADSVAKEQPNVSKALKRLIKHNKIMEIDPGDSGTKQYAKFSEEQKRKQSLRYFVQDVSCISPYAFRMSETVILVQPDIDCIYNATEYIKRYLGEERCFDIQLINGYLFIMIKSTESSPTESEALNKIYADINAAVIKAHKNHQAKQPKQALRTRS